MQLILHNYTVISMVAKQCWLWQRHILVRFSFGAEVATIVKPPPRIPPPPLPAIARPMMRAVEVGATPQIREPISKMTMNAKKVY